MRKVIVSFTVDGEVLGRARRKCGGGSLSAVVEGLLEGWVGSSSHPKKDVVAGADQKPLGVGAGGGLANPALRLVLGRLPQK